MKKLKSSYKIILIGAAVNLILALLKITVGSIENAHTLIADGYHSFSDLITDAITIIAVYYSYKKSDDSHPYGHGKIETLISFIMSVFIMAIGFFIAYNCFYGEQTVYKGTILSLLIAFVSVLAKELLFRYTVSRGKKEGLKSLALNAWHHRTDAFTSIIAFVSIAFSNYSGFHIDKISAFIIAGVIVFGGWKILMEAVKELVESSLDEKTKEGIKENILNNKEVLGLANLYTRSSGRLIHIDVDIKVNKSLSLKEAHAVSDKVSDNLKKAENIGSVRIHIEPV